MPRTNHGGSLLPSAGADTYTPKEGKHGTFTTASIEELDTHALFYNRKDAPKGRGIQLLEHPNGYSCDAAAKRIIQAWETGKEADMRYALEQVDYILACGGLTRRPGFFVELVKGEA